MSPEKGNFETLHIAPSAKWCLIFAASPIILLLDYVLPLYNNQPATFSRTSSHKHSRRGVGVIRGLRLSKGWSGGGQETISFGQELQTWKLPLLKTTVITQTIKKKILVSAQWQLETSQKKIETQLDKPPYGRPYTPEASFCVEMKKRFLTEEASTKGI